MHIALDLSSDLAAIAEYKLSPAFKTIASTNLKGEETGDQAE